MPELPEVETICRGLSPVLTDSSFKEIIVRRTDLRIPVPDGFAETLKDAKVIKLYRHAKYIILDLGNAISVLIHLGMSGRMVIHDSPSSKWEKHDHIIFQMHNGKEIVFNDTRRFGVVTSTKTKTLNNHPLLIKLGVEPLSGSFNGDFIYKNTRKRKTPIKHWIMDAHNVVGVGNIYACESLFRAGILPESLSCAITIKQCKKLASSIKSILEEAIEAGGSSLRDYVQSSGEMGYFQHNFNVYGKEGKPCGTCKMLIQRIKQSGRSTFFCPVCQS